MTLCEWAPQALAATLLAPELCEVRVSSEFVVRENDDKNDGAAEVTLRLPVEVPALLLHGAAGSTGYFRFFSNQKCADGVLLVDLGNRSYAGYILECKRTVNPGKLADIERQLAGALCKLRAIVGLVEGRLVQVQCFTAYRKNDLRQAAAAGPILHRQRVGQPVTVPDEDWQRREMMLLLPGGQAAEIPHHPVRLNVRDGTGYAQVELTLPSREQAA